MRFGRFSGSRCDRGSGAGQGQEATCDASADSSTWGQFQVWSQHSGNGILDARTQLLGGTVPTGLPFTQQLILLLVTAALIPLVFYLIDWYRKKREIQQERLRKQEEAEQERLGKQEETEQEHQRNLERARFEAKLARQAKVIDAQDAFLDDISQQFWRFRYLAMTVSYYRPDDKSGRYQEILKTYDQECWTVFNKMRESISRSRRLVSEKAYNDLVRFYEDEVVPFDREQVRQVISTGEGHDALNQHIFRVFSPRIDAVIYDLSREVQLTSEGKPPRA